jgi:two-component system response regulator NreC
MPVRARILLVDDHHIVREGFRALLDRAGFEIVAEASDGWEAVRLAQKYHPDIVVMDVSMPLLNGMDAARAIIAEGRRTAVVLLTVHAEEHYVVSALRAGVRGYIIKTQAATELLDAIREVLAGGMYLSPRVSGVVVQAYLTGKDITDDPLTARDRQVLQLVAEGKTTKDVAATLDLKVKTAEYYRSRVMSKLGIHDVAGLVRYAIVHGLIQLAFVFSVAPSGPPAAAMRSSRPYGGRNVPVHSSDLSYLGSRRPNP